MIDDVMNLEVLFGPADFERLDGRDLSAGTCVVLDVLRATSTMVTALANGALAIRPVSTVEAALEERARDASVMLAGERGGRRIGAEQTGGIEFDFGNSPREFTADRVAGRKLVMTTTNGTRAFRACAGAGRVLAGSFLNLSAVVRSLVGTRVAGPVLIVCSGTGEETALEDVLAAGAIASGIQESGRCIEWADSAWIALGAWGAASADPAAAARRSLNARRLLSMPDLAADVELCLRCDTHGLVPEFREGVLRCEPGE